MLINQKAVKTIAKEKGLRVSKEFLETLDAIVRDKITKALQRNKSLNRKTLKKDELYM